MYYYIAAQILISNCGVTADASFRPEHTNYGHGLVNVGVA